MALRFECPICKHVLTARDEAAGSQVRCPDCSYTMLVPRKSMVEEPANAAAPVDPTDLLAVLGERAIEAPPQEEEPKTTKLRFPTRPRPTKAGKAEDESLYDPRNIGREKARQREESRGMWGVFVADCFRCVDAFLGFSSVLFMVILLMILAGAAFAGEVFLFRSSNGKAAQVLLAFIASGPGRGVCTFVGLLLGLYVAGYFTAYFIESTNYKLKAMSLAPCFPGLAPGKLIGTGVKALGLLLVYIAPIVTIPLLPLGLMALAQTGDWRAFDLIWAAKAALRKSRALAVVWGVSLLFFGAALAILGSVWPFLGSFFTTDALGAIQGPTLTLILLAVGVGVTLIVVALAGAMIASVAGVLGWHYPDLLAALPPRSKWVGSIASGAIVASVGAIVVAGSPLAKPFLFSQNAREVAILAWFFADATMQTAPEDHVSPEPEQWEAAWNDFFPIKAPPVPPPPVVKEASPAEHPPATQPARPAGPGEAAPPAPAVDKHSLLTEDSQ